MKKLGYWCFLLFMIMLLVMLVLYPKTDKESDVSIPGEISPLSALSSVRGDVDITKLKSIVLSDPASDLEKSAADVLIERLKERHGIELKINNWTDIERAQADDLNCIFVGRASAKNAVMITDDELEKVKYDGFVIKSAGNRIAVAGYNDRGTMYGAYKLLEELGVKIYGDGRNGVFAVIHSHVKMSWGTTISEKPFFEYRDAKDQWWSYVSFKDVGEVDGRGAPVLNPELFTRGKEGFVGYASGQHNAIYLVPPELYYDEHPEYYAMRGGKRIPFETSRARVNLCLSNRDVYEISEKRALKWIELQKEKRFFWVGDGDGRVCGCDECRALDPRPGLASDRNLAWVNHVAGAVLRKYPEKIIFTLAYIDTVAPPFYEKPEANVIFFYCPWWRDSRSCNGHTWICPDNMGAMKQFMDWIVKFPGHLAVYDYGLPQTPDCTRAELLKFFAKNRVRGIYYDGRPTIFLPLHVHITRSLMWNPYQDSAELRAQFLYDCFGPAGKHIGEYLDSICAAYADRDTHWASGRRGPLDDPEFRANAVALFGMAGKAVKSGLSSFEEEKEKERHEKILYRIYTEEAGLLEEILKIDDKTNIYSAKDLETYRTRVARYIQSYFYGHVADESDVPAHISYYTRRLENTVKSFLMILEEYAGPEIHERFKRMNFLVEVERRYPNRLRLDPDVTKQVEKLLESPGEILKGFNYTANSRPLEESKEPHMLTAPVMFNFEVQLGSWEIECTNPALVKALEISSRKLPRGVEIKGTKAVFNLIDLPVEDNTGLRGGMFSIRRDFQEPLDVRQTKNVEIHLYSSSYAPVTINVKSDSGIMRVNTDLFPGEQIIRIQLSAFGRTGSDAEAINSIEFELRPQERFPQPATWDPSRDVPTSNLELIFVSVKARNRLPDIALIGHDDLLWMSRSRSSNINRGVGTKGTPEPFRAFQRHSELYPVYGIVTATEASDTEKQAALILQEYLERIYGVSLPVTPAPSDFSDGSGNVIVVGREPGLRSGMVRELELEHVGSEGFVLHGEGGRIAIAGYDDAGTLFGVTRFLEQQGVRFFVPGAHEVVPDLKGRYMYEVYLLDRPEFARRKLPGGWKLKTGGASAADSLPLICDIDAVRDMAVEIKRLARAGKDVTDDVLKTAGGSSLAAYVASRLLWDPFADTSSVINDFIRETRR